MKVLSDRERAFVLRRCVAHLATASAGAVPHLVPVCFALGEGVIFTAIDEKPKNGRQLRRLRNIAANPLAAFLADHYNEDWSRLGWVLIEGRADILHEGIEFECAVRALRDRYPQLASMQLQPAIAVRISRVRAWGNLDV